MNFTLDSINRERELEKKTKESKEDIKRLNSGFRTCRYDYFNLNHNDCQNDIWSLKEVSYHVRIILGASFGNVSGLVNVNN